MANPKSLEFYFPGLDWNELVRLWVLKAARETITDFARIGGPLDEHLQYLRSDGVIELIGLATGVVVGPSAKDTLKEQNDTRLGLATLAFVMAVGAFQPYGIDLIGVRLQGSRRPYSVWPLSASQRLLVEVAQAVATGGDPAPVVVRCFFGEPVVPVGKKKGKGFGGLRDG